MIHHLAGANLIIIAILKRTATCVTRGWQQTYETLEIIVYMR